jgi:hypothetical protein
MSRRRRHPLANAGAGLVLGLTGGCVSPADPPSEPIPVPFVVSDYFSPDGFFGDGEMRGFLELTKECPDRQPGSRGDCYTITYKPGIKMYAGIFWQHPHNNWGTWRGYSVSPGATRIVFKARSAAGGETVKFGAGQMGKVTEQFPHQDRFKIERPFGLTPTWTEHQVMLDEPSYSGDSGLIGGFMFSMVAPENAATTVFYLDDIRWVP